MVVPTFEQELQESPKFHNDAHLFHGYARFNTFWKINTVFCSFSCSRYDYLYEFLRKSLFIIVLQFSINL
jgi:hypothetical protein